MKELELYLHIPFCMQKCRYCDFPSGWAAADVRAKYVDHLCQEMQEWEEKTRDREVTSVFVGGGTPSILTVEEIKKIFYYVYKCFNISKKAEITIEMNPGTVKRDKLAAYKEVGINRLSIGCQSLNDQELKNLGRIHTEAEFYQTYEMAREEGFENISMDLMSAIPGQTLASWEKTLRKAAELEPEHISAYSLIIEEGTPFYERYGEGNHSEELPTEEEERLMYERTEEILEEYGYHRYEISNYAKEGKECRHNLGYWERTEYLGLGYHAASLMDHKRWVDGEEAEVLTIQDEMEEFMFLGLRKMKGVSRDNFYRMFGKDMDAVYKTVIEEQKKNGLLKEENGRIFLSRKGIDLSNYVMSEFLID